VEGGGGQREREMVREMAREERNRDACDIIHICRTEL
jgi:hypothetical protein